MTETERKTEGERDNSSNIIFKKDMKILVRNILIFYREGKLFKFGMNHRMRDMWKCGQKLFLTPGGKTNQMRKWIHS